jgi:hypothetical protein
MTMPDVKHNLPPFPVHDESLPHNSIGFKTALVMGEFDDTFSMVCERRTVIFLLISVLTPAVRISKGSRWIGIVTNRIWRLRKKGYG